MLNFYLELERVIPKWPENANWTVSQIADYTNSSVSITVDAISTSLNREFDLQETITASEGKQVLASLKDRLSRQLELKQKKTQADREAAMRAYDLTMTSIRVTQQSKDWRTAYKTLAYFVGRHEKSVDHNLLVSLCGDLIRLGQKAECNLQELGAWMRKAVESAATSNCPEAVEDALDFIDTYGHLFSKDRGGVGGRILNHVVSAITIPANDFNLDQELSKVQELVA